MSLTVLDNIGAEIVRRLETLKTPSAEQTEVVDVIAPVQYNGYTPDNLQIIVQQGDADLSQIIPGNPPALEWNQTFLIQLQLAQLKDATEELDVALNRFTADAQKVLTIPQTTWHQFAGNAINAVFGSPETTTVDALRVRVIPLIVTYRVSENNPYEVRA